MQYLNLLFTYLLYLLKSSSGLVSVSTASYYANTVGLILSFSSLSILYSKQRYGHRSTSLTPI